MALIIALVMLVALTLASTLLVRSISTTNLIAGNMAFQQAAINSADVGIQTAITWLQTNNVNTTLHNDSYANGYIASRQDPASNQTWDDFWTTSLAPAGRVRTLAADASGNTVAYVIHRLCNTGGDPTSGIDCNVAPAAVGRSGNSKGAGVIELIYNSQVYYRITARVTGPRGTLSYVQSVIAL
ncbi:hypothetical protein EGT07_09940 [Herbaspirillum sp. HC18]|nr:hypothetical protein EGT07_09940 [Herbaspirillum sp. HC18]